MDWNWFIRNRALSLCIVLTLVLILIIVITSVTVAYLHDNQTPLERADKFLSKVILFDGHNDLPFNIRELANNDLTKFNFSKNLTEDDVWSKHSFSQTDLPKLRAGGINAQFWVARAECESQFKDAVEITLEQIDVIKRLVANYSSDMLLATSYSDVMQAVEENKIASLISVGGGHSIQSSFAILRLFYELGVRSITFTQSCSTPWADGSGVDNPTPGIPKWKPHSYGLSPFGEEVVVEMNRLGMIIDISFASIATMKEVLIISKAPVIFSHSAARGLCNTDKNVPDEILKLVRQKDAVIMVNFYPGVLRCDGTNTSVTDVVEHIEYLRNRTTINNVGLGSDFDGFEKTPEGLENVSKFPNIFAALIETGRWSEVDMEHLAGKNVLRVLQEVEHVRDKLKNSIPSQMWIRKNDLKKLGYNFSCTTAPLPEVPPQGFTFNMGNYNYN